MSNPAPSYRSEVRSIRERELQKQTAAILHDLAYTIEAMAKAMDEDDGILGALSGMGLANHLPALPKHVRDVFLEYLSDEAVAGYQADQRYFAALDEEAVA